MKITDLLGTGVQFLVDHSLLPFTAVLVEPAKVLFLNNAINHGVFTPIGTAQALEAARLMEALRRQAGVRFASDGEGL